MSLISTELADVRFGPFHLDVARRALSYDGAPVKLGSRALDILCVLTEAAGDVVSKETPGRAWIAVLPFQNISDDPAQDYFADGIVEEIITGLARSKSVAVIARNSTFVYKGKAVDIRQVGRQLGVTYVLEGSVRKAGDSVRVTAQLIDANSRVHLWAERYDRSLDDIFAVQDDIAMSARRCRSIPGCSPECEHRWAICDRQWDCRCGRPCSRARNK